MSEGSNRSEQDTKGGSFPSQADEAARTNYNHHARLQHAALGGLAGIIAVVLRWRGLDSQSLWWDEGFTLWLSKFSPADICRTLQVDTSPPLYYILEHYWTGLFGISEVSLRGLSAFFETLSIPVFWLLAKRVLGNKAAVTLTMWLYSLSLLQVAYAKEARFYGLLTLLSLVSVYSLVLFLERRSVLSFCFLVLSLSASLYTHNMMFFYLPAIALVWLVYPSARLIRVRLIEASLTFVIVLLSFLPWLPTLWRQTKIIHSGFWLPAPTMGNLMDSLCILSGLNTDFFHDIAVRIFHLPPLLSVRVFSLAALLILTFCAFGGVWHVPPEKRRKSAALLAYSMIPVLMVFFVSRTTTSVYLNRLFIGSSAVLPILFCTPIAFQAGTCRRLFQGIGIAVLAGAAVSVFGYFRHSRKEDWWGATNYVLKIQERQRLIVFAHSQGQVLFDYYAAKSLRSSLPREETGLPRKWNFEDPVPRVSTIDFPDAYLLIPLQQAMQSNRYAEIDVVISHAPSRLGEPTLEYLRKRCASREDQEFNGVRVMRCFAHRGQ
jgi:uncharacterized membrane protein